MEMTNPKMQTLPSSTKEKSQDDSSQLVLSSPSTGACPRKMSEVDKSLSTPDNSRDSMKLYEPSCSKKLDLPTQEGHRDRLYASLKALINKIVSQLRKSISDQVLDPDPISYVLPQNNVGMNVSPFKRDQSSSAEVKSRAKSTLVGEETVDLFLPPDCLTGTDLEKNVQCQSSFEERLRGWHIACRQRANGKIDMNYRHELSRRMFRSTVEVVEFILVDMIAEEAIGSDSLQEQGPSTAMKGSSKRKISFGKREKVRPSESLKISSAEKAVVVQHFLQESDDNLKNICGSRRAAPDSEEGEKHLKPSSRRKMINPTMKRLT